MATTFGTQSAKVLGATKSTPNPGFVHGSVRVYTEQVTLAAQAAADIIVFGMIPKGSVFLYGILETDTSLGSTTLAISSATLNSAATTATVVTAGKYRAAATFTATDTPTFFGATAATGVASTSDEIVVGVIAAATAPASGLLRVTLVYSHN